MADDQKRVGSPLKIALLGRGKMGQRIAGLAEERGDTIVAQFGKQRIIADDLEGADVCIDFSHAHAVLSNIQAAAAARIPIVLGTTGWEEVRDDVIALVTASGVGCVASHNFSIGFALFLNLVKEAAKQMNPFADYDPSGWESHHRQKPDAPSGSARMLADALVAGIDRKKTVVNHLPPRALKEEEIHFGSHRCGAIPGSHTILFDSPIDTITLSHQARNRDGFATGALDAAQWVVGKSGFFTMDHLVKSYAS